MTDRISLAQADPICQVAFAMGAELGLKPLTVAVLDAGGHLIELRRQDGAASLRVPIAYGKAGGALGLGMSGRKIAEDAAKRPTFVASLTPTSSHGVPPARGGVIVVDASGRFIGAVGIAGDASDKDEICVQAGIAAAGLTPQA